MAAKVFQVGDVLPIGRVKINWDCSSLFCSSSYQFNIWGSDASFLIRVENNSGGILDETVIFIGDNLDYPSFEYLETDDLVGSYTIRLSNEITIGYVSSWIADFFTWEVAPPGFSVTFEENGGSTVTDLTEQTALPTPLPTPTKRGYKFVAWYYESNFQTRAKAGDTIEANITLYAKWHNLRTLFIGIANAIRSKDGTSGNIRALDFDDRIMAIAEGKPIEVSTAAAMDNLLVSGNVGKIYKFTGPTDANYINGELYEVVSD